MDFQANKTLRFDSLFMYDTCIADKYKMSYVLGTISSIHWFDIFCKLVLNRFEYILF